MLYDYLIDAGLNPRYLMCALEYKIGLDIGGYCVQEGQFDPRVEFDSDTQWNLYCIICGHQPPNICPSVAFVIKDYFKALVVNNVIERQRLGMLLLNIYTACSS